MKHKEIIINDNKDAQKFERKIWLYRGFLYNHFEFNLVGNNAECEKYRSLINALNIKKRKKRIEYIYDTACDEIDKNNKCENVDCEFKNGQCLNQYNSKYHNGCCRSCPWQSDTGCTTRNLTCKLFFCDEISEKYNVLKYKNIKILKALPFRSRLIIRDNFFIKRENFLNTLYWNSIIIYGVKLTINLFKIIIFNFKSIKNNKFSK